MSSPTPQFKSINASADQDGRVVEGHALIFSCENSKITTLSKQPSTGECWIPPKKDTPHPRAKEKPQQDGRRGEITFRIKLHTHQRQLRAQTKPLCAPGPRDPTETERDLCLSLLWRYRSEACCRDRGSGCSYLGHTACCISSLGGSHH